MSTTTKFKAFKKLDLKKSHVSLAIIKEYKLNRVSQYDIKFVRIDEPLENRLKGIVIGKISEANSFEEYTFDCPEPDSINLRSIEYGETDFLEIMAQLSVLTPEDDNIDNVDELLKAKAYLIILHNKGKIHTIGFKTIPESWKMKKAKGLIPLLYDEDRFKDLDAKPVFSISSTLDFIFYDETLFILSKKEFEKGLNFREGMIAKAGEFYEEIGQLNLLVNLDILQNKVGNNQIYLRKIAVIKNLGYYNNQNYIAQLKIINQQKNWGIQFQDDGKIIITEETLDTILTLLQNKRLHSLISEEDFDVDNAKLLD